MSLGTRDPELQVSFTRGETVGLTVSSLAGTASVLAAVVILVVIFVGLITARVWLFLMLFIASNTSRGELGSGGSFGGASQPLRVCPVNDVERRLLDCAVHIRGRAWNRTRNEPEMGGGWFRRNRRLLHRARYIQR